MAAISTMVAAAVGAAGVATSMSASKNAKKATQSAAQASQDATDASLTIAREARDATTRELRPYASAGTDALAQIRGMLGLGAEASDLTKQVLAGQSAPAGAGPASDIGADDVSLGPGQGGVSMAQLRAVLAARTRAANPAANPAASTTASQTAPAATGYQESMFSRLLPDAEASFESSPWWQFAQTETQDAINDLDTRYGASGLLLSGQAVRARAEIAARLKGEAFDRHYNQQAGAKADYLSSLFGLVDGGRQAASGIGSGGANYATTATQALSNNALVRGQTAIAGAEAQNNGTADALGFGGWALGQVLNRPSTTPSSSTPTSLVPLSPLPQFGD